MHCYLSELTYELCQTFLADLDGQVTVFRAFLDESGTHDESPVITVAGYVARPGKWREFVPKWERVLRPSGIKVFHSVDCNAFRKEFEGWDRERRDALVRRLLPLLPGIEGVGLAIGIVLRDLDELLKEREYLREYLGSPYQACLQWWLQSLIGEMQKKNNREPVAVVHEENQYAKEAKAAYDWVRQRHDTYRQLVSFSFGAKQEFVPLQAADILAYDVGKRLSNLAGKPRKSYEALTPPGFEPWIRFYHKKNLPFLLSNLEIARTLTEWEGIAPAFRRPS
jgi:hypothetical protein